MQATDSGVCVRVCSQSGVSLPWALRPASQLQGGISILGQGVCVCVCVCDKSKWTPGSGGQAWPSICAVWCHLPPLVVAVSFGVGPGRESVTAVSPLAQQSGSGPQPCFCLAICWPW